MMYLWCKTISCYFIFIFSNSFCINHSQHVAQALGTDVPGIDIMFQIPSQKGACFVHCVALLHNGKATMFYKEKKYTDQKLSIPKSSKESTSYYKPSNQSFKSRSSLSHKSTSSLLSGSLKSSTTVKPGSYGNAPLNMGMAGPGMGPQLQPFQYQYAFCAMPGGTFFSFFCFFFGAQQQGQFSGQSLPQYQQRQIQGQL